MTVRDFDPGWKGLLQICLSYLSPSLLICLALLLPASGFGQKSIVITQGQELYHLHHDLELWTGLEEMDVPSGLTAASFQPYQKELVNAEQESYWLRFNLENPYPKEMTLYLNTGFFDIVKIYQKAGAVNHFDQVNQSGFLLPKQQGVPETYRVNLAPITIGSQQKKTYYIHLISKSAAAKNLAKASFNEGFNLMTWNSVQNTFFNLRDHLFLFSGALLIISFFNFFIAIQGGKKLYYRLAIYNLICCLVYLNSSGYSFSSGLVDSLDWVRIMRVNLAIALILSYNLFAISFLELKSYFPALFKLANGMNVMIALCFPLYWAGLYNLVMAAGLLTTAVLFPIVFFSAIHRYRKGHTSALVFLLSSGMVVIGFLNFVISSYFQTEHFYRNELWLLVAAFLEVLVFTYLTIIHFLKAKKAADLLAEQQRLLVSEKKLVEQELVHSNKNLITKTADEIANYQQQQEMLTLLKDIKRGGAEVSSATLEKVIFKLNNALQERPFEQEFLTHFNGVHKNFVRCLTEKHPNLTPKDIKICAYLKMNLSSLEISKLQGVAKSSVNQSRFRIRKKMELAKEVDLVQYIATF